MSTKANPNDKSANVSSSADTQSHSGNPQLIPTGTYDTLFRQGNFEKLFDWSGKRQDPGNVDFRVYYPHSQTNGLHKNIYRIFAFVQGHKDDKNIKTNPWLTLQFTVGDSDTRQASTWLQCCEDVVKEHIMDYLKDDLKMDQIPYDKLKRLPKGRVGSAPLKAKKESPIDFSAD